MIDILYDRSRWSLRVTGHALAGQPGRDLVCAAVSALTLTAAANLAELADQGNVTCPELLLTPGDAELCCLPAGGMERVVMLMLDTLCTGFQLLQHRYPEYVRFRLAEAGKETP